MKKMIVEIEAEEGRELNEAEIMDGLARIFMTDSVGMIRKRNGDLPPSIPYQGKPVPVYDMNHIPEHLKKGPSLEERAKGPLVGHVGSGIC